MFFYIFGILTLHYILKPIRAALFLQNFPASDLPYAYFLTALVAGTIATIVFRLARRVSLLTLVTTTNLAIIASLLAFRWAVGREFSALPYVYYAYVQTVSALATTQFWLMAGSVYDTRQAKRVYGVLAAGGIAGAMAGSLLPGFFSDNLSTEAMLLVTVGVALGLTVLANLAWRYRRSAPADRSDKRDESKDRLAGLLRLVAGSQHLRLVALLIVCTVIGSQLAEWQLNEAVQAHYADLDRIEQGARINEFFGRFYLVINILGILLQIGATGFIIRRFGILSAMVLLPLGLFIGALGVVLVPGLVMATLTRGTAASLGYSTNRTAMELVYLPLSPMIRERLKVFVDLFVDRLGRAIAGVVVLLLTSSFLPVGMRGTAVVILILMSVSVMLAYRVRQSYVEEFRRQIERSEVDLSEMTNFLTDPASVQMLVGALGAEEERRIRYALRLLQSSRGVDFRAPLVPLLHHESDRVRAEATRTLPALGSGLDELAEPLLRDESDAVRYAAIDYLLTDRDADSQSKLDEYLRHEDPRVRTVAARWAAEKAPPDFTASLEVVEGLLGESDRDARAAGVDLAARMEASRAAPLIRELLSVSDPALSGRAARSGARLGDLDLADPIVEMLALPGVRVHAKAALVEYGQPVVDKLRVLLSDESRPQSLRREIPWVLSRVGGSAAARVLAAHLASSDHVLRYRVLKALNHLHERSSSLPISSTLIEVQIRQETARYYEAALMSRSFNAEGGTLLGRALRERLDLDLEVIFRLLGLRYPQQDIYFAYTALRGNHRNRRTAALEFMDNVLRQDLKSIILPLLEETSSERLGAGAAEHFGIRIGSIEESLRRIIEDRDSWLKSCALHEIGNRRMTQMEELCRRLAEGSDALVRESALWAVARLGEPDAPEPATV